MYPLELSSLPDDQLFPGIWHSLWLLANGGM
jgi:hypothetical protein